MAVLLDNFTAAADQEKQRKALAKAKEEGRTPVVYAIGIVVVPVVLVGAVDRWWLHEERSG